MSKEITFTKDNILVLDEAFTSESVAKLMVEARKKDSELKSGYPMYLFLNTPGGSIQAGLELDEGLKGLNRPIHTVTLFAASMGWQLVQHLGDRYVLKYGTLMSHKARGSISGEFGGGHSQLDSRYGLWLRKIDLMDKQTVDRTNGKKTLKQYRSEYDNELWLNGAEAVANGYADEVVTIKCDKSLDSETRQSSVNFLGMKIDLTMSGCPIITYPVSIKANIRTNKGLVSLDDFLEKGGKFGKKCNDKGTEAVVNFSGDVVKEAQEPELCTTDKTLNFEKIKELKEKVKRDKVSKFKKVIYMSFLMSGNY